MADVSEARLRGDLLGPAFDRPSLDFHAAPAGTAGEVMVMAVSAALAVERLAAGVADRVDPAVFAEYLQVPVNGSQPDVLAPAAQLSVDLLGAAETRQAVQHERQRLGLPGPAATGGASARRAARA